LALEVLAELQASRAGECPGLALQALARRLRVDPLHLQQPLRALQALGWVGRLSDEEGRWVLLVDLYERRLADLARVLWLAQEEATAGVWRALPLETTTVAAVLPPPRGGVTALSPR
ncbi:MAG: hypothetical protein ACK40R_09085, partial [Thermomonas sp.]